MRHAPRLALLGLAALAACQAETFSPSANWTVELVSGAVDSIATAGQVVGPLVLRVLDERGAPVVGHPVQVAVVAGDGRVSEPSVKSGPDGLVVVLWTLGARPSMQQLDITPLGGTSLRLSSEVTGFPATQLAVGLGLTCAIDPDARAWCWGDGGDSATARGDSGLSTLPAWHPVPVAGGHRFAAIAAGRGVACALDLDGAAWCWGNDANGTLGQGAPAGGDCGPSGACSSYPLPVTGGHSFFRIAIAGRTACAEDHQGAIWCWGDNHDGRVGTGLDTPATVNSPTRALTSDSVAQLVAGDDSFCARYPAGNVVCWGTGSAGEIGASRDGWAPISPETSELFSKLFAGADGFCGRRADGATWCWGRWGDAAIMATPTRRADLDPFPEFASSWMHIFALDRFGRATIRYQDWSADIAGDIRLNAVQSGGDYGCGLGAGGQVWCWGGNSEGQLGVPTRFHWLDANTFPAVPVGGWQPLP